MLWLSYAKQNCLAKTFYLGSRFIFQELCFTLKSNIYMNYNPSVASRSSRIGYHHYVEYLAASYEIQFASS